MRKFLCKIVILSVPIFLFIATVNIIADPANIFSQEYESKLAAIILKGKNVVTLKNYNERIFQEKIILGGTHLPDTLLLGSSRTMGISSEIIPNMGNYWNAGVSGAGLFDYLGILGIYYYKYKDLPKKIFFGLDPWILNDNNGDTRWEALTHYARIFTDVMQNRTLQNQGQFPALKITCHSLEQTLQLFSVSYLQSSLRQLIKTPPRLFSGGHVDFYGTSQRHIDDGIRYVDGSIEYKKTTRDRSMEEAKKLAKEYTRKPVYQMEKFYNLSKNYSALFIQLLDFLQDQGIELIFFLPPFHPYVYRFLSHHEDYKIITKAEVFLRHIAQQRKIHVWGSYNPEVLQCHEDDFLDGMHLKRSHLRSAWK